MTISNIKPRIIRTPDAVDFKRLRTLPETLCTFCDIASGSTINFGLQFDLV